MLGAVQTDQSDIRRDMVHFDQAFIPVWLYVREGNMQKAKSAVFAMEFQWQKLRGKFASTVPEPEWQDAFLRVDGWLSDAYFAIDNNASRVAFNQLEYAKYELRELRRAYKIDYYIDHLYQFQDELDVLTEAANDEMLCMMDWQEFEAMSTAALQHWRTLMVHPFDADLYELETDEENLFREYQSDVESALMTFYAAVETGDREAVATASPQLGDAFMPLLRLFGNFNASRTYYAATRI